VYEAKVEYEKCAASTSQPVRTEISSLLSPASWFVFSSCQVPLLLRQVFRWCTATCRASFDCVGTASDRLVKATFRDSQGEVIRYTEVDMDRICSELRPYA